MSLSYIFPDNVCVCVYTVQPQYAPDEVLHQSNVKFSCWYEQGKKSRGRYIVLKRDCRVEIHESMEVSHNVPDVKVLYFVFPNHSYFSPKPKRQLLQVVTKLLYPILFYLLWVLVAALCLH